MADDVTVTEFNQWVAALKDVDVLGANGTKIGEVDEVLGKQAVFD
ncbi:hypothetical protein [Mesorhizobium sp. CAU 1732]